MQCAHADHIVAVYQGGGLCDLENLRTLCVICHQVKSTLRLYYTVHDCPLNVSWQSRAQSVVRKKGKLRLMTSAASAVWLLCCLVAHCWWETVVAKAVVQQTGFRTAGAVA